MLDVNLNDLLDYTEWDRKNWHDLLRKLGDQTLRISAGAHGDGRFETIGDLVRHIFSAEKRYIDRLSDRPLFEAASIPNDKVEALFDFGRQSRKELRDFVAAFPRNEWDRAREFKILANSLTATPRKIMVHVVTHEIRHWAQISTLLRLNGLTSGFHDLLLSPVMGSEIRREQSGS
jgi:uncharacterized damage-inducible protein DinB